MGRKFIMFLLGASLGAMMLLGAGCGGDDKPKVDVQSPAGLLGGTGDTQGDFNQKLEELKKAEMTVELIQNGKAEGKWSQNSSGSWRWEDSSDKTSYMIFNADKKKMWVVNGDTAIESTDSTQSEAAGFNPALLMSSFAAMTYAPRTGGSDDTWEWEIPGSGKLTIEFKGPNGLVTKVIDEDYTTKKTDTTEFVYSDVGNVADSLFELPSNVTVQTTEGLTGGLGTSTDLSGLSGGAGADSSGGYTPSGGLYGNE